MRTLTLGAALCTFAGCCSCMGPVQEDHALAGDFELDPPPIGEAESEPPHRHVTYVFDAGAECATARENRDAAAAGFASWAAFGVEVTEADALPLDADQRRDVVSVCFAPGPFWGTRLGSTSWTGHGLKMTIRTDAFDGWVKSIAAHELGHVILESADHVDDSRCGFVDAPDPCGGIMGGRYVWSHFTERDVEFAEARGLAWESAEPTDRDL